LSLIHSISYKNVAANLQHLKQSKGTFASEYIPNTDSQLFYFGSILSFLFADDTVEGGYRFWLGIVTNIVIKKTNNSFQSTARSFKLKLNEVPKDLMIKCNWLKPVTGQNIKEAIRYEYCDSIDNRDYVAAEFIINVIDMEREKDHAGKDTEIFLLKQSDLSEMVDYVNLRSQETINNDSEEDNDMDVEDDAPSEPSKQTNSIGKRKRSPVPVPLPPSNPAPSSSSSKNQYAREYLNTKPR
jgi:hypothetical protein